MQACILTGAARAMAVIEEDLRYCFVERCVRRDESKVKSMLQRRGRATRPNRCYPLLRSQLNSVSIHAASEIVDGGDEDIEGRTTSTLHQQRMKVLHLRHLLHHQ